MRTTDISYIILDNRRFVLRFKISLRENTNSILCFLDHTYINSEEFKNSRIL